MADKNSEIENLLEEIAKEEGFLNYDIKDGDGSNRGDGYLGLTKSVRITSKDNKKVLNLFIKSASVNDELRKNVKLHYMFNKEIFIYGTIFPIYKDLELKNGLEPSTFSPIMYKGCGDLKRECIILENLKENGYKLHECSIPLNDDHVSLVMSQYGRLHALSYALKSQEPETFSKLSQNLDYYIIEVMRDVGFLKNTFLDKCIKLHESLTKLKYDQKVLCVYKSFVDTMEEEYMNFSTAIDSYAVILHGDCWTNNMMFKYDKENAAKPISVQFFDYQIARIGSPVLDLSYFFYCCSSQEIINNWKHYLNLYHTSLSYHLQKLGCDAEKLFPYEVLEDHWLKYARYGFMFASLIIFVMNTNKEETITFEETVTPDDGVSKSFNYEIANNDKYLDRIGPIVEHFVNNNLF